MLPEVVWIELVTQIAGGTGITPFVQLVHHFKSIPPQQRPALSLLYASSNARRAFLESHISDIVADYQRPVSITCLHTSADTQDALVGKLDETSVAKALRQVRREDDISKVLVCGPDA